MKRKLLSVALLALLSVGLVAACDNDDEDGGNGEYSITITNKAELQEAWTLGGGARTVSVELSPEGNPTQELTTGALTVESSAPTVIAATGLSLTPQGLGQATITVNWHGASDSVALSVVETAYDSIASINAGIKAGTIKDGDTVSFYGKVVGSMEQSTTHLYSGVYLADGDESLMLYAGSIDSYWFDSDGEALISLGDNIGVTAVVSYYSDAQFYEFKPSYIEVLGSNSSYVPVAPSVWEITEDEWGDLTCYDVGRLATATVKFQEYTIGSSGHITINATYGETDVVLYVNYHNGTEQMEQVQTLLLSLSKGTELTVTGVIGWFKGAQLCPNFIYVDGKELTPIECMVKGEQSVPTSFKIAYEKDSVRVNKTLQLSIEVNEGANPSATWTSSNPEYATVSENGLVTGIQQTEESSPVTITATSTLDATQTDSIQITILPVDTGTAREGTYVIGVADYTNYSYYYLTGEHHTTTYEGTTSYYGEVTTSWASARQFTLTDFDDGTTISFDDNGTTKYLHYPNNSTQLDYSEEPTYWVISDDEEIWSSVGGRFVGKQGTGSDMRSYAQSNHGATGYYAAVLLTTEPESLVAPAPVYDMTLVTELTTGSEYYLAYFNESAGTYYFFDGGKVGSNDYYLSCSTDIESAAKVTVTSADSDKWTLTFGEEGSIKTLEGWLNDSSGTTHAEITYIESGSSDTHSGVTSFNWNSTYSTVTITLSSTEYYLEYNQYNGTDEIQLNGISYIGSTGKAFQLFTLNDSSPD